VAVVVIAGASLLGVGSLLSSADEGDGAEPATTTTTEVTTTTTATAPTCEQVAALVDEALATRAIDAYDAATAANAPCTRATIQPALDQRQAVTDQLEQAAALRRGGDVEGARAIVEAQRAEDPSDPRPPAVLDEMADAQDDLQRIERLRSAGYRTEAKAAYQTFFQEHPNAPADSSLDQLNDRSIAEQIVDTGTRWTPALAVLGAALALGLIAFAFGRTLKARLSTRRLVLAPFVRAGAEPAKEPKEPAAKAGAKDEGKDEDQAATKDEAKDEAGTKDAAARAATGAASEPAATEKQEGAAASTSPEPTPPDETSARLVETLVIQKMNGFRSETSTPSTQIAAGPDGAIDLPSPDALPEQLSLISALSVILPTARSYTVAAELTDRPEATTLALRLVQGPLERGKLRAATTLESTAEGASAREGELASMAAAWIAFTWSAERGLDEPLKMGGTSNWLSYAEFAKGVSCSEQKRTADAVAAYTAALRIDAGNVNALVNLAANYAEPNPHLAIRFGERALRALGDDPAATTPPDVCCAPFAWLYNWYRAQCHVATALLNLRHAGCPPGSPKGRVGVERALVRIERVTATIAAVRRRVVPPPSVRPGTDTLGASFFDFLQRIDLHLSALRVVALVELDRSRDEIDRALDALPLLHPHASYNLACALARSPHEHYRMLAFDHLEEAKAGFSRPKGASGPSPFEREEALAPLREKHPRRWRKMFPPPPPAGAC